MDEDEQKGDGYSVEDFTQRTEIKSVNNFINPIKIIDRDYIKFSKLITQKEIHKGETDQVGHNWKEKIGIKDQMYEIEQGNFNSICNYIDFSTEDGLLFKKASIKSIQNIT
jgi:hypothetical protein